MAQSTDLNKKLFGRCTVEWRIDNFSLQTLTDKWVIQSPEFTINGFEETSWCMNLRSELINKSRCVLFSLRRSDTDSGPKYTWLNLDIHCICSDAKSVYCDYKVLSLKNGSKYEVRLGAIEYLLSEMDRLDDLFKIVCDMIVYSNSASRAFGECNHPGLKLLSKNMLDLYKSAQNFDTKLVFDENVILAHRAILCARNEYLSSLIIDGDDAEVQEFPECTIINFTDRLDYKGMRKILAYLYSGDIRHVLEEPSFAIYYSAIYLGISEIENYYEPDELIFKSTIDFQEYTYILHRYKFENSRLVWCFDTESSSKTYQLLFYPVRQHKADFIPLFEGTFEKPMIACLEFNFAGERGHVCTVTATGRFTEIENIISGTVKKLYSSHKISEVVIKLKLSVGMKMSSIDDHNSIFVSYVNKDFHYECLSADLEALLDGGPFADIVIDNNGTHFWIHKCVLLSRSRFFSDLLTANEEGEAVVVPNIEPRIVSILLTYIYAGILLDVIDEDVIDVYKAAVWSNLPQLKSMCSDWLRLSSKINTSIRCRAMRIAEQYGDVPLMKSILNILFDEQDIFLAPNRQLSFRDAHSCRYCREAF